ncbi:hypothetical protein NQ314_020420 [Rhamnusium bicolor]|uniref:Coiled-coil domain-containing protein 134 n=1 Tax=Rhamnusium bicolor TaxID=1586634 RepID=A0AAV8WM11_9CUCU|nr:hypothetical protein NQ314_020420 [Rhamnusium bicolor]
MFKGQFIILIYILPFILNQEQPSDSEIAEKLYIDIKLFKRQRAEQLEAIKSFKKISNYEKQYSMIMLMAEKVFSVIQDSRAIIEASPYIPGVSDFPLDNKIRDALSNILENTALFSDIILRFPDITVSVLKANNNWDVILQWGIAFCHQVKYLLDKNTVKLLYLVSQELDHVERESNYVNPYRRIQKRNMVQDQKVAIKKKRKQIRKGPKLSSHLEL